MILREQEHFFIMIAQHDHANFSGQMAEAASNPDNSLTSYAHDFIAAVYQHDRSWIPLDDTPLWNEEGNAPFSFQDYPLAPKLEAYKQGLDEVETQSFYAALLCSMHYVSFFKNTDCLQCRGFVQNERSRQERIRVQLVTVDSDILELHFRWLQFFDDLSLYVCLNDPGSGKQTEHPWYKDGFPGSDVLTPDRRIVTACWMDDHKVQLSPLPFATEFSAKLRYKLVLKAAIREYGLEEAYKQSEYRIQDVDITGA